MEYLNSSSLEIFNRGTVPAFGSGTKQEATDITLGSFGLL